RARIARATLRWLLAAGFAVAGGMKLIASEFEVAGFRHFEYDPWLMYAVGAAQVIGAALLLFRGYAAIGAGLLALVMVGAVASHLRAGDPVLTALPPLILLTLLLFVAYAQRRRLRQAALAIAGS
ncbi:DoxX family protein, partial [Methylobacterium trifolii]